VPGQAPDPTGVKILDAASRVLADFGFKRATVELVAKYAAVSHMTVYRRWSSKGDLLRFAVLRELSMLLDAAFGNAADVESFDEKVVRAFTEVVWSVRNHPLMIRELNTEPEVLLAMMSAGSGSIMETAVPLVAQQLSRIADADTSADDLEALADVFVRLAHSVVLVQHRNNPLETRADLDVYARRFFEPLPAASFGASVPLIAATRSSVFGQDTAADDDVAPRAMVQRHRLQLAAASLLAVLLVGAGLSAVFVRQGGTPLSPDLIRTEQSSAPSVSLIAPAPRLSPAAVGPDTVAPGATEVPTLTTPPSAEQSPLTSSVPTFTRHPTTSRGSFGGAGGPVVGEPQRPPKPFHGTPPSVFAPGQPATGPGPARLGPNPGQGGPGPGGRPSR
jgi:AcrR family transcriptional regulator